MATREKTREALEGSIQKWEHICDGTGYDNGPLDCPLCELFGDWDCYGCVVYYDTGVSGCVNTPYGRWMQHVCQVHAQKKPYIIECPECEKYAVRMLNYLISLRPVIDEMRNEIFDYGIGD
jgi:hypothetical protein